MTSIPNSDSDDFKLSGCVSKYCDSCGEHIVLKLFELYEVQNHNSWMHWKRLKVKHWWTAFDADSPNQKHICNKQQVKQTKSLNHGVAA